MSRHERFTTGPDSWAWSRASVVVFLLVASLVVSVRCEAEPTQVPAAPPMVRALLIGIAHYSRALASQKGRHAVASTAGSETAQVPDLDGPLNDVEAVRTVLIAQYGVDPGNIKVLKDEQATRDGILDAIRDQLLKPSKAGDYAFFYYSGHGSEVPDPTSDKPNQRAQSIVPFASRLPGGRDIRDKELRAAFNNIVDRAVHLTAVFDCCYSGSITRGLPRGGVKYRVAPPDLRPQPTPGPQATPTPVDLREPPTKRGALALSACLETQEAPENAYDGITPRGLLTYALEQTMLALPANASASDLYRAVLARTAALDPYVQPVLAGDAQRALLAATGEAQEGLRLYAVKQNDSGVFFRAGKAVGLTKDTKLREVGQPAGQAPRELVITQVDLASCWAAPQGSVPAVQSGTVFEVSEWAASEETALRLFLPEALPDPAVLPGLAATVRDATAAWGGVVVDDPTKLAPTHTLGYADGAWVVETVRGCRRAIGARPTKDALLGALRACPSAGQGGDAAKDRMLFWNVPPSAEFLGRLADAKTLEAWSAQGIERTSLAEANYQLVGRWHNDGPEHAWVRCGVVDATGFVLPDRSDWQESASPQSPHELQTAVTGLATISSWLQLAPPPGASVGAYRLRIRDKATGKVLDEGKDARLLKGSETQGPFYEFCVESTSNLPATFYAYVVMVEPDGQRTLLFPDPAWGVQGARVELDPQQHPGCVTLRYDPPGIYIDKATGNDMYILLTTSVALDEPSILEGKPVKTKRAGPLDPLSRLLDARESHQRGGHRSTPTNWSIARSIYPSVNP